VQRIDYYNRAVELKRKGAGRVVREVVVVGAGPGGSTTAADLARRGHDVLLLDRQPFPRDKPCGDAVPAVGIETLHALGMRDRILAAVEKGNFYPLRTLRLVSPGGYVLEARFRKGADGAESYVAPRVHFDAVVLQGALDAGAEFRRAQVIDLIDENERVTGVRARVDGGFEEIRARMVIGADGVSSVIARRLRPRNGGHRDLHRAVALRAYLDGFEEHPHRIEFYLLEDILPGYAWIFPLGQGRANVGLGLPLDHLRRRRLNLEDMLQRFLETPQVAKRLAPGATLRDAATWPLNLGSQRGLQHAFEGALLVGDAAGLINPLSGGGLKNTFISARLAARTAHDALIRGDTSRAALRDYEKSCQRVMWAELRRSFFLQRALLRFPVVTDLVVRGLGGSRLLSGIFLRNL